MCDLSGPQHCKIKYFSGVSAPYGFYGISTSTTVGNSYICFKLAPEEKVDWFAGQIQHVFQRDKKLQMAVKQSKLVSSNFSDPFMGFWKEGFKAKLVLLLFSSTLEVVDTDQIITHTTRWQLSRRHVVVLNLC
ncbi:hypothetical protein K435DRAFT_879315 [Dendrothele bispora CBS 962.96]|uniref:Uncharacterized protein n=1 Tax=Dendrothele bispora (strain CBS 962.96) TaxID=1314807 RepID=A0A4S8KLH2_DENBC|nr:hypothetical protein K435DRAFT_879315 [Dendrothele bispora CBS 962.96]